MTNTKTKMSKVKTVVVAAEGRHKGQEVDTMGKSRAAFERGGEDKYKYTWEELQAIRGAESCKFPTPGLSHEVRSKQSMFDYVEAKGFTPALSWTPIAPQSSSNEKVLTRRGDGQPKLEAEAVKVSGQAPSQPTTPLNPAEDMGGAVFNEIYTMLDNEEKRKAQTPNKPPPPPLEPLSDDMLTDDDDDDDEGVLKMAAAADEHVLSGYSTPKESSMPAPPQLLQTFPVELRTPSRTPGQGTVGSATPTPASQYQTQSPHTHSPHSHSPSPSPAIQRGSPSPHTPGSSLGYHTASVTPQKLLQSPVLQKQALMMQLSASQHALHQRQQMMNSMSPPNFSPSQYEKNLDRQAAMLQLQQLKQQQDQLIQGQADLRQSMLMAQQASMVPMPPMHHMNLMPGLGM